MRKYSILIGMFLLMAVFILCPFSSSAEEEADTAVEYGLNDLIVSCFQRNIDIKTAVEKESAQLLRVRKAKAKNLPGVTFTGVYSHIGVVPYFDMPGFEDIKFVSSEMLNFTLTVDYMLFDWGMKRDGVNIEQLGLMSQRLSHILMKKGFILRLSVLYYNILQVEENETVIAENINILNEILRLLKQQFDAGIIPEHQLLQTRVVLQTLRGRQLELKKLKTELTTTLKNISGLPLDRNIKFKKVKGENGFSPGDLHLLVEKAAAVREDFQVLNLQLRILEKSKAIISKSKLPLFSASLNAELRNGIMPEVDKLKTNWNVGLAVTYNIFDRGSAKFEKEVLDHELQALRLNIKKIKRDVKANLLKLMAGLHTLDDKIEIGQNRLELAKMSLQLARESFKESRATYLEVLNARSNYNLAESSLIALKYLRHINLLQVKFELFPLDYFLNRKAGNPAKSSAEKGTHEKEEK